MNPQDPVNDKTTGRVRQILLAFAENPNVKPVQFFD